MSSSNLYEENNFKPCLTKRLLSVFKLWCECGIVSQQVFSISRTCARIWNMIPPKLPDLSKPLFKRKLHNLLLKGLETEEVYVDMSAVSFFLFLDSD